MNLWTLILIIIVCVWLYFHFKKQLGYFEEHGVPYMPGWPLFGNMAAPLFRQKSMIDTLESIYNSNPEAKYIGMFDFMKPVIMLRDLDVIKSVTIKHFDHFPDHRLLLDDSVEPMFSRNLFNLKGDEWRESRNLLSPAFTSSKIKAMFEMTVQCTKVLIKHLSERPQELNEMVDTKDLFKRYTTDVLAICAFGISVDSFSEPKNSFYEKGRQATTIDSIQTLKYFIAKLCPWIYHMFNMKFIDKSVDEFLKNLIGQAVAMRDEKGIRRQDILQLMMDARGKDYRYLKLDITEMTGQMFIFFFAGLDTASSQMSILAHVLAIHPHIQTKLQSEIDEVLAKIEDEPSYELICGLPYLDAVFNESLRRHMHIAFLDRLCVKPFELPPALPGGKPFTVQPGMNIFICPSAIHKDPKYFEDPLEFNPNRYYEKKMPFNDVTNLGFGIGPRSCIGNRFGIMEIKVLFFYLLAKFNLKPNAKTSNPLKYSKESFNLMAEGGFWLKFEPRNEM